MSGNSWLTRGDNEAGSTALNQGSECRNGPDFVIVIVIVILIFPCRASVFPLLRKSCCKYVSAKHLSKITFFQNQAASEAAAGALLPPRRGPRERRPHPSPTCPP